MLFQALHQLQIFVSYLYCSTHAQRFQYHVISVNLFIYLAQISIVSAVALNSTAVNVTWTPLNVLAVDHYTVHYSKLVNGGSGRRRRQVAGSEIVTFPANTSSGVVSGLQEGQQYQFSVSVSLLIGGQTYNSTPGVPKNAMTGIQL